MAATTPLLMYSLRCLLMWKLGKEALEKHASVKIGGLNPLAPSVEINSHTALSVDGPAGLAEIDSTAAQHRPDGVA
ncbi:hypothetical protein Adi01nite_07770 [Amorphoplanes digitatis]|nr:hypothetical protein Adi01nite_07770 [Actinoplanes digitatis]